MIKQTLLKNALESIEGSVVLAIFDETLIRIHSAALIDSTTTYGIYRCKIDQKGAYKKANLPGHHPVFVLQLMPKQIMPLLLDLDKTAVICEFLQLELPPGYNSLLVPLPPKARETTNGS